MDAIVYDLEIIKAIPQKNEERMEGLQYCEGWNDHKNMGISVVCAYDFVEDRYRVFCEDNFDEFFELLSARSPLIGFNNFGFDNKVLRSIGEVPEEKTYDLLQEIWRIIGRVKGTGLDAMCSLNGLGSKSGNGALAPVQWQRGEVGAVIDYCLQDVKLTKDLFLLSQEGSIKSPKGGNIQLRKIKI